MAWSPDLIVSGGLYGGGILAQANMDPYAYKCQYVYDYGNTKEYLGDGYSTDSDNRQWNNCPGTPWDKVQQLYVNWNNPTDPAHEFLLAEIFVKNPPGAQYYRQSITIYASVLSQAHTDIGPGDFNLLNTTYFEFTLTKICRREYPTPYSTWTEEILAGSLNRGFNGYWFYSGNEEIWSPYDYMTSMVKITLGDFDAGEYWGISYYKEDERVDQEVNHYQGFIFGFLKTYLDEVFGGSFEPEEEEDPNEEPDEPGGGESGEGGGDGDHDKGEDNIPDPGLPPIGAASAGFVHMFKLTLTEMVAFARTMFEDNLWQALKNWFSDPMDFISGVMLVPFTPEGDTARYPKFGSNIWPQAFTLVSNQFYRLDCGHLKCKRYYDSFLDYDSYTKVKIFLPYVGYKDLNADEVMGNDIHVYYNVDVATGDCVAFIEITADGYTQVTYQFQGNCGMRVPYGRQSYDAAVSASLNMLTGAATTALAIGGAAATGGALAPAAAGIAAAQISGQIGSMTASAISGSKRTMERSGAVGGSSGYMGVQFPYLIRQIPNQSRPGNYRQLHGYPSNIGGKLGTFQGYTTIEHILLEGLVCTDTEKSEIIEMLKGGVII